MVNDPCPLLSICIPTCNRAGFLKVMLQALLPQVRECGPDVEVWVLDNASTDDTPTVLEESRSLGPFQVKRQPVNVGPVRNIVDGPTTLAQGHFVWVLGDHNLLRPHALKRVLDCLRQHPTYDLFYVNFRAAEFPTQWPHTAAAGYDGPFQYLGNPEIADGVVERWHKLMRPYSAACTQCYVHIIATGIWQRFWKDQSIEQDYSSALTTYPHTMTIVSQHLHQPAVVVADPVITIFNGAQSWGDPVTRVQVFFIGLTGLLKAVADQGLPRPQVHELWSKFFAPETARVIRDAVNKQGRPRGLRLVLKHIGWNRHSWYVLLTVLPEILLPRLTQAAGRVSSWRRDYRSSYVYNFRPTRWLRAFTSHTCAENVGCESSGPGETTR